MTTETEAPTLSSTVGNKGSFQDGAGVAHIELTNYDFTGLFEGRGYSDDADIPSDTSGPQ